jgi:hypothetical protein
MWTTKSDEVGRTTQGGELAFQYDAKGNRQTNGYPGGAIAPFNCYFADREAALHSQEVRHRS